jgi:hypothetical protein
MTDELQQEKEQQLTEKEKQGQDKLEEEERLQANNVDVEGESDNVVKTHANSGTDRQAGQQTGASSAATTDLQRKSNTNTETRASMEDNSKNNANVNYNSSHTAKTISSDDIIRLHNAGLRKLVPLLPDSKIPNVYDHLITEEEIKTFPSAEGRPVRIIYQKPNFWTEARLKEKSHLFYNVATTFGLTDLDSKGRPLYLYCVDVDTKEAYEALKDLIETLKGITFVVESHKEYGHHFYILTPVLHEAMGRSSFKLGAEIEIKTDLSLGMMHLPPSRHRRYPYWNYKRVSTAEQVYVDEDDKVFQEIIKRMSTYLRKEPTEENILTLDTYPSHLGGSNVSALGLQKQPQHPRPNKTLTAEQYEKIINIILNNSNSYVEYARNDFVYGLSGHLFHNGISEFSAISLTSRLCKLGNDEADARLDVVSETYKKGITGKPIRGISQLKYLLAKYNNEDEVRSNGIIAELNQALGISTTTGANTSSGGSSGTLGRQDDAAEAILRLAESNGDIFFKDTFGQPCALINMTTHVEVVSMDGKRFESHLRRLLKRDLNKRIISKDSLEKATEALKSDAVVEGRTIPLNLRVAWKKKNEIIYYDPTDERWSCIAIERDTGTWRILPAGSLTDYPIPELRNQNSKLIEQPIVFTRYGQIPQVMPERSYPPDIMQQFIDKCTNLRDPKDQLLFKAYLITLFIPDIAHVILLLKGVKGAAKSILETIIKRIIDPSPTALLILNKRRLDFIINIAHNYYNAYDNVKSIPDWLSGDICAATTGAGFSVRTLYYSR